MTKFHTCFPDSEFILKIAAESSADCHCYDEKLQWFCTRMSSVKVHQVLQAQHSLCYLTMSTKQTDSITSYSWLLLMRGKRCDISSFCINKKQPCVYNSHCTKWVQYWNTLTQLAYATYTLTGYKTDWRCSTISKYRRIDTVKTYAKTQETFLPSYIAFQYIYLHYRYVTPIKFFLLAPC